jgi:hypothetical protein
MDVNNEFYKEQFAGFVDEDIYYKPFTGVDGFFNFSIGKGDKNIGIGLGGAKKITKKAASKVGGLFGKKKKANDTKKKADELKAAAEVKQLELQNATTDLDIAKKTAEAKALMNKAIVANKEAAKAEVEAVEAEAVASPEEKAAVVNAGLDASTTKDSLLATMKGEQFVDKGYKTWYYVGGGVAALLLVALLIKKNK